jgi:cell division septal protein FtsQ
MGTHERTETETERNTMTDLHSSRTYRRAVSFKWLVGLIFIVVAVIAYLVGGLTLYDAALLFGIGVILV